MACKPFATLSVRRRYLTEQPDPNNENVVGYNNKKCWCDRGVPSRCGAFHVTRGHRTMPWVVSVSILGPFLTEMLRAGRATSACGS